MTFLCIDDTAVLISLVTWVNQGPKAPNNTAVTIASHGPRHAYGETCTGL